MVPEIHGLGVLSVILFLVLFFGKEHGLDAFTDWDSDGGDGGD